MGQIIENTVESLTPRYASRTLEYDISDLKNKKRVNAEIITSFGALPLWTDEFTVPVLAYTHMEHRDCIPLYGRIALPYRKEMMIVEQGNKASFVFEPKSIVIGRVGDIDQELNQRLCFTSLRNILKIGYNGALKEDGFYTLLRR